MGIELSINVDIIILYHNQKPRMYVVSKLKSIYIYMVFWYW